MIDKTEVIAENKFVGKFKNGTEFYVDVNLRYKTCSKSYDIQHNPVDEQFVLSITGNMRGGHGQIADYLYDEDTKKVNIVQFGEGFDEKIVKRLYDIWKRWHLNDLNPHCIHQDKTVHWTKCEPCTVTGYKCGESWLYEPLPEEIVNQLYRFRDVWNIIDKVNKAI
jgi:hypothetical protein